MKVLVACEESQAVCIEFRRGGHEAYSCDIQDCSGGHPEWHIKADARELLKLKWDLIIAHPPCTYLASSGAIELFNKDHTIKDVERYFKGLDAARFFRVFLDADCERIAIENPTPMYRTFELPMWTQTIEPYMFGDPWRKRTRLWLKGLDDLKPTNVVKPLGLWVGGQPVKDREKQGYILPANRNQKNRSKTFPGIAKAMAAQWGGVTEEKVYIEQVEPAMETFLRMARNQTEKGIQVSMF